MTYKWAAVLLICVQQGSVSAKVYRWTDEQGVTHFGQQLPAGYNDLREPKTIKKEPLPVNESVPVSDPSRVSLNCEQAVSNGRYSLALMHKTANDNFTRGTINEQALAASTDRADLFINKLSIAQCEQSTGFNRAFYACAENYKNHILYCVEQFEASEAKQLAVE